MAKLIKNWRELSEIEPNNKYKIEVDIECGYGWIKPIVETEETEENYFKHHYYLSTHTFYGSNYEHSTKILQGFGFDVEIDNWDNWEVIKNELI